MRISYDKNADAVYIKLSELQPDGVVEISEGANLDTTNDNKLVGIEILAPRKNWILAPFFLTTLKWTGLIWM